MANATGTVPAAPMGIEPHRVAWGILLLAFAAFCVLCLVVGLGLQYFFFQSTIPMPSMITVARGTAGVTEADQVAQAVTRGRELYNRARVSTDGVSQATISFMDRANDGKLVASVTVRSNSSLDVERVERPRFNWSVEDYNIDLSDVMGDISIRVNDDLGRGLRFVLDMADGTRIVIERAGRYTVSAGLEQVQVSNFDGAATLISSTGVVQPIPIGDRAVLNYASGEMAILPGYVDLILGDSFLPTNVVNMDTDTDALGRSVWRCRSTQIGLPDGQFDLAIADGRSSLHMWRGGGADSHGETFCIQNLGETGQNGLDVSMYDYLAWRASFKIMGHSLGTCGVDGSECPMTLRMDYIPMVGDPISWYHGFYAFPSTQFEFPPRCNTCAQDHQIINDNAWYNYDSGNLFALIPPDQRPKAILNVRFYASGHEYEVFVNDVSLLAGQGTTTPAFVPTTR
ncbi:MAG: hypothetical protein SGI73_10135 [Chloroflexota bacterium]|nr:hypothetical protein [Chloroflexota bacterium]